MPITQKTIMDLMRESRANILTHNRLRSDLLEYFANVRARYYNEPKMLAVMDAAKDLVNYAAQIQEFQTMTNEHHYRRVAKVNDKQKERQATIRRAKGVPTVEEAMVILNAKNALHRADLPTQPAVYKSDQELRAEYLLANPGALSDDPFANQQFESERTERKTTPSRPGIIFPRDDPDDPELEFETPEELAPIANLLTGAVDAIIDPLAAPGENNPQEGIDNQGEPEQDRLGNNAKESRR